MSPFLFPEPDPEPVPEPEPEGPVVTEFVRLVMTSPSSDEAFLRNFLQKSGEIRLRSTPMSGYDTFRIMDEG